jgi:predicted transcriptional regulator
MPIGSRLKEFRRVAGIPRFSLARAAAVSELYIAQLERGEIQVPKADKLVGIVKGLASISGQHPMQVLEYLLQDMLADTNAPAGGGR